MRWGYSKPVAQIRCRPQTPAARRIIIIATWAYVRLTLYTERGRRLPCVASKLIYFATQVALNNSEASISSVPEFISIFFQVKRIRIVQNFL